MKEGDDGVYDDDNANANESRTVVHSAVTGSVGDIMDVESERQLLEQCLDYQGTLLEIK